jgi:hypothetical protein
MENKIKHDISFQKNKIVLQGLFSWMLYANIGIIAISYFIKFLIFIVTLLK